MQGYFNSDDNMPIAGICALQNGYVFCMCEPANTFQLDRRAEDPGHIDNTLKAVPISILTYAGGCRTSQFRTRNIGTQRGPDIGDTLSETVQVYADLVLEFCSGNMPYQQTEGGPYRGAGDWCSWFGGSYCCCAVGSSPSWTYGAVRDCRLEMS